MTRIMIEPDKDRNLKAKLQVRPPQMVHWVDIFVIDYDEEIVSMWLDSLESELEKQVLEECSPSSE